MLEKQQRLSIESLLKREVVPAVGCTEPAAVALAVAKATETLGSLPSKIDIALSGNMLKNAMGVGIPGTGGMIGLPIAAALGALVGKSAYGLEVLKDVDNEAVSKGRRYLEEGRVAICHLEDTPSILHISVTATSAEGDRALTVISGEHTRFVLVELNGVPVNDSLSDEMREENNSCNDIELTLATVWEYALESPLEELEFILEARDLNLAAARMALDGGGKGHKVGYTIKKGHKDFAGSIVGKMLSMTSAACDARMAGEPVRVMSNSGSGNQGIAITMPVVTYAEETGASRQQTIRALILAHLTSIYIKQSLGRLSALCGCVVASTGAALALVYLMGGDYVMGTYAVKNMIATLTGMICDGAKPACSLKIASGAGTAYISALMAINGHCVTSTEGIVDDDVDATIQNFSTIGREAMLETDRMVLRIMSDSSKNSR